MTSRRARVARDGHVVGVLEETEDGFEFRYSDAARLDPTTRPISLTLPVRDEPYRSKTLHPFFENLLPEGWLLELSTQKLKIGKDDAFGLLLATCADCIGAIEITPDDEAKS